MSDAIFDRDLDKVLDRLRHHRTALRDAGIVHVSVFGSVARGQAGPASDVDLLVEFAEGETPDLFRYAELRRAIADWLPGADVVDRGSLLPLLEEAVLRDAVRAF